ncbi:hypothetical protein HN419_03065 [Candidatus Woesearchaeota archaeon]|jgi:hypothetical protein|nr:hypothetical protein [Candidatus Woesearchaeota archaeon]MBT3537022.1 hypothetical protein [Candidatus Woesearchaeota archaeon]MBT4697632.1 hypothetical protein [Candidatus Woesearchaeota archaeon]MBT4716893.1 hypothetical protein [Candidatus Woesearchaeota archaeon]MBT7106668.1 hypothetical protein [Candidatus Woesearchaeota archaeon]
MSKKCFICGKPAEYMIKDSKDAYCLDCAEEHFGDLSYLVTVEDEAKRLKTFVEGRIDQLDELNSGEDNSSSEEE